MNRNKEQTGDRRVMKGVSQTGDGWTDGWMNGMGMIMNGQTQEKERAGGS